MGYDSTLTVLENGKVTDLTPKELQQIETFKESGLPGITTVNDVVLTKALDLYLGGKTYHEVCRILSVKKEVILYLGQKFNWYGTKMEQLEILDATLKERILHAKLVNQDFVLQIQQFFLAKIGRKINKYLATGDEEWANKVDGKDIDRYNKAVELLDKLTTERVPMNARTPAVGLNLGEGMSIKKVGENEVIITPRNKTAAEMLNELANLKRKEDKESENAFNDIKDEESEGNNNES